MTGDNRTARGAPILSLGAAPCQVRVEEYARFVASVISTEIGIARGDGRPGSMPTAFVANPPRLLGPRHKVRPPARHRAQPEIPWRCANDRLFHRRALPPDHGRAL